MVSLIQVTFYELDLQYGHFEEDKAVSINEKYNLLIHARVLCKQNTYIAQTVAIDC